MSMHRKAVYVALVLALGAVAWWYPRPTPIRSPSPEPAGVGVAPRPRATRPSRPEKPANGVFINGSVFERRSGKPIVGARVHAVSTADGSERLTRTDKRGRFRLHMVPGQYRIRAAHSGHVHEVAWTRLVVEGAVGGHLRLPLVGSINITGRVVNHLGQPVARAEVRAVMAHCQQGRLDIDTRGAHDAVMSTHSAKDGTFRLAVPQARVLLQATRGDQTAFLSLAPMRPITGLRLQLGAGHRITGRIEGPKGERLGSATVSVRDLQGDRQLQSDASGRFMIPGLAGGAALLQATSPGHAAGPVMVADMRRKTVTPVVLTVQRAQRLRGLVLTARGEPQGGVRVAARPSGPLGPFVRLAPTMEAVTSLDGRFSFSQLGGSPLQITASLGGSSVFRSGVTAGMMKPLILRLGASGGIVGRLELASDMVRPPWRLMVQRGSYRRVYWIFAPEGRYSISGLQPGVYDLTVFVSQMAAHRIRGVRVAAGVNVRADFGLRRGGRLSGVVRDRGGQPLAGVKVELMDSHLLPTRTDGSGRYQFDHVVPGRMRVVATAQHGPGLPRVSGEVQLDVRAGRAVDAPAIKLAMADGVAVFLDDALSSTDY